MEHRYFWEANVHVAYQKILRQLCKSKFKFCIHGNQITTDNLPTSQFKAYFDITSHLLLGLPSDPIF
jgi:hypothetical protein